MRIIIKNAKSIPIQERFDLYATMIDDVKFDHRGKPSGFTGLNLSPKEMADGTLIFDMPYTAFAGKHRLFAVNCTSAFGAIKSLNMGGPAWSMVVFGNHDPLISNELQFPTGAPGMQVFVEGGEIVMSSQVDPAQDDNIFGHGSIDRVAKEYVNLKNDGIISQLERGEYPYDVEYHFSR